MIDGRLLARHFVRAVVIFGIIILFRFVRGAEVTPLSLALTGIVTIPAVMLIGIVLERLWPGRSNRA